MIIDKVDREQNNDRYFAKCDHCGKKVHEIELNYERHGDPKRSMHVCDICSDHLSEQDTLRKRGLI